MTNKAATPARRRRRQGTVAVKHAARKVQRQAKNVVTNPWAERAARLGYVVRGIIYGTMGILALGLAFGIESDTTDQRGALALLDANAMARLFLLIVVVSLLAYSAWGLIRAIYDPLHRGDDPAGISSRIGFAWSGLNYAALAVFAAGLLLGGSKSGNGDSVQQIVGWALRLPFGGAIVIIAGLIGIFGGLSQFVDAYKAGFRKDLKRNQMTKAQRVTVDSLGRFGMVARGVIFGTVGIFIVCGATQPRCAQFWPCVSSCGSRAAWSRPVGDRGAWLCRVGTPLMGERTVGADAERVGVSQATPSM